MGYKADWNDYIDKDGKLYDPYEFVDHTNGYCNYYHPGREMTRHFVINPCLPEPIVRIDEDGNGVVKMSEDDYWDMMGG